MSVNFHAIVFYGVPVEFLEIDPNDLSEYIDEFNESYSDVELINVDPMGKSKYMLMIKDSYHSGDEWGDVDIKLDVDTPVKFGWRPMIEYYTDNNDLQWLDLPSWRFVTYYS